ncbi:MAG: PRC-barrel domain-containing protein [Usitatibacter sp.]
MQSILFATTLMLACLVAAAQGAPAAQPVRAMQLLDAEVVAPSGRVVGAVRDFVVDTKESRVAYAVLAIGSFVDVTDYLAAFPLPTPGLTLGASRISLDTTRERVRELGGFPGSQWPDFNKPAEGESPSPEVRYQRATELANAGIVDRRGNRVGEVEDLLVNPADGKLVAVVVKFIPAWHDSASLVALPPTSLGRKGANYVANFEAGDMRPATAAAATPAPAAPAAPAAPKGPEDTDLRLTRLIGTAVVDPAGQALGQVRDLVLDARTYQVTQTHIASGDRVVAFPTSGRAPKVLDGKIVLESDAAKLAAMPAAAPQAAPGTVLASSLLKALIVDSTGKGVGTVEDVVVSVERARAHYGVAQFTPNWVQEGKLVALPLRELKGVEGGRMAMRFDLNELNTNYFFDKASFPEVSSPQFRQLIDRYFPPR